jgi:hypothetical protein
MADNAGEEEGGNAGPDELGWDKAARWPSWQHQSRIPECMPVSSMHR